MYTVSAAAGGAAGAAAARRGPALPGMVLGPALVAAGLAVMFPAPGSALHAAGARALYASMVLCGAGEMFMSSLVLSALARAHAQLSGAAATRAQNSLLTALWFGAVCVSLYLGRWLGGVLMDLCSWHQGGRVYVGLCVLANLLNLALYALQRTAARANKTHTDCLQQN